MGLFPKLENELKLRISLTTKAMKERHVLYLNFSKTGTPMVVDHTCAIRIFPTKNFSITGEYEPVDKLGVEVQMTRNVGSEACYGCPVGCSQIKLAQKGPYTPDDILKVGEQVNNLGRAFNTREKLSELSLEYVAEQLAAK